MKNLLGYDEFLNESNEVIKAQGACKSAIFQVQKEVDKLFNSLLKDGLIQSYSSRVKPWNQGYEIRIDAHVDYKKVTKENADLMDLVYKLTGNTSVSLQPSTWFETDLEEGKTARLEGTTLEYNGLAKYNDKYPRFDVKSKSDIDKAAKQFVDYIKDQIEDIQKELSKLSKINESQEQWTYTDKQINGRNATKLVRAAGEQELGKYVKRVNDSDTELIITKPSNPKEAELLMDIIDYSVGIKNLKKK